MRRLAPLIVLGVVLLWLGIPAVRAAMMVETRGGPKVVSPSDLRVRNVRFTARDGVRLDGWLVLAKTTTPTIILVAGFKSDRMTMLPYARFLHSGGYNVLLYDDRGTGRSDGHFTVGTREVDDVLGAIDFITRTSGQNGRHIGLLGVSLGAGVVIVAAARDHRVRAAVADSAYTDEDAVLNGINRLHAGPLTVPLAPVASIVLDRLTGVTVSDFRPIDEVSKISPRALLLIHSLHDTNPTTPLSGASQLWRAARAPVTLWVAPRGGHGDALAAQPAEYHHRVLAFFRPYLRR